MAAEALDREGYGEFLRRIRAGRGFARGTRSPRAAERRSNAGIGRKLFVSPKTVEAHVHTIFQKLDLAPAPDDHRRVLAVLAFLRP